MWLTDPVGMGVCKLRLDRDYDGSDRQAKDCDDELSLRVVYKAQNLFERNADTAGSQQHR